MKSSSLLFGLFVLLALLLAVSVACDDDDDDDDDAGDDDDDNDDDNNDDTNDDDDDTGDDDTGDDDDDNNDDDDDNDTDPGDAIEPTAAFLDRQDTYLQHCYDNNGPGQGGRHGQSCRVYLGASEYNEATVYESIAKINAREDTSDFDLTGLLRMLYLDREAQALPATFKADIEDTVLNFKYWLDEPGPDDLCWWSENHQILYHSLEYLAGQLFPDDVFPNSGMTGTEHMLHAEPLIHRWMKFRGYFGFSEWHSNVYFQEDMPPLINLADFAEDEVIATKAAMIMDMMAFDMAMNYYHGLFATTHGRTYPSKLLGGLNDSTRVGVWIMLGLGEMGTSTSDFTGSFLATSDTYFPPPILEAVAVDSIDFVEHKQRDSITIEEGPEWGIGYEAYQDVMFWWGATGYAVPEIVDGTFAMVNEYNLWESFLFSDIAFLKPLVNGPLPRLLTTMFEDLARGVALERVSTYTHRTPNYQLSGAQDFKPGMWAAQVHIWQATLDKDAYVFTTYPGGLADDYAGGPWTGGFLPRATLHENVGVIQYRRPQIPLLDQLLFVDYSHAYFPKTGFDEWSQSGNWAFGRKGDAYVALYSENPTEWATDNDYELIADAKENVWIVELGDIDEHGSYAAFVAAVESASVTITEDEVSYGSPTQGAVVVGWEGEMTVDGATIDLGPYERWENIYCQQPWGTNVTTIEFDGARLELDYERDDPRRRYWEDAPE